MASGKFDLNVPINDPRGMPIMSAPGEDGVHLTAADVCMIGLLDHAPSDGLSGQEKFTRGQTGAKIAKAKADKVPVELKLDEVETTKKVVGDVFKAAVVLAVWSILDG